MNDIEDIPEDTKVMNCGDCGRLLVTPSVYTKLLTAHKGLVCKVFCYVNAKGRRIPFCKTCGTTTTRTVGRADPAWKKDEQGPWNEDAAKAMEERGGA